MSYSIVVVAATKAAVIAQVSTKFEEIVSSQPVHQADADKAKAATEAFLALIDEPGEGFELNVTVNGYLSWNASTPGPESFVGASFGVTIGTRQVQAPAEG